MKFFINKNNFFDFLISRHGLLGEKLKIFIFLSMAPVVWLLILCWDELNLSSVNYLFFGVLFNSLIQCGFVFLFHKIFKGLSFSHLFSLFILVFLSVLNFRFNVLILISADYAHKIVFFILFLFLSFVSLFFNSGYKFSVLFCSFLIFQAAIFGLKSHHEVLSDSVESISNNYKNDLENGRNIYFIGLDSLPSEEYYSKKFHSDPVWVELLKSNNFRQIKGA